MCFDFLYDFLNLRKTDERDLTEMYVACYVKYPFLSEFNEMCIFSWLSKTT
jgi:hypothetical protein